MFEQLILLNSVFQLPHLLQFPFRQDHFHQIFPFRLFRRFKEDIFERFETFRDQNPIQKRLQIFWICHETDMIVQHFVVKIGFEFADFVDQYKIGELVEAIGRLPGLTC